MRISWVLGASTLHASIKGAPGAASYDAASVVFGAGIPELRTRCGSMRKPYCESKPIEQDVPAATAAIKSNLDFIA
jgi:hypothetical protein